MKRPGRMPAHSSWYRSIDETAQGIICTTNETTYSIYDSTYARMRKTDRAIHTYPGDSIIPSVAREIKASLFAKLQPCREYEICRSQSMQCNRKRIQRYKTQLLINAFSITVEIGILYLTSVAFTNMANLHHISRGLHVFRILRQNIRASAYNLKPLNYCSWQK